MIQFLTMEEFYSCLPVNKEKILEHTGLTEQEFYLQYSSNGITIELDKKDISDLMTLLYSI